MGLTDILRRQLEKTRHQLFGRLNDLFSTHPSLDEESLERIEEILITADIGVQTSHRIIERLKKRKQKEKVEDMPTIRGWLEEELVSVLSAHGSGDLDSKIPMQRPLVVLVVGVNGTGKTTTIGKLAGRFAAQDRRVLVVAGDTFRAAAGDQLRIWADRAAVEISSTGGDDPAAIVFEALEKAKSKSYDVVLIDTAGRLHTKVNLMEELKKIRRVIGKQIPGAPHETLLVIDGTTGQNALAQAREFSAAVSLTGLIVTKLDGTAKGGAVIPIQQEMKIPIYYVGVGEALEDLISFDPGAFIKAITE